MSKSNISEEFKRDAVRQIIERGYPVAKVSQRLEVNKHSFYEWEKKFAASNDKGNDEAKDLRQHALPAHQIGEGPVCRARARLYLLAFARCGWPAWLITPLLSAPEKSDNLTRPPIVEERRTTNGIRAANARFCSAHK